MNNLEYAQAVYARHGLSMLMSKVQQKEIPLEDAIEAVNLHFESFSYRKQQFICNVVRSVPTVTLRRIVRKFLIKLRLISDNI